MAWPIIIMTGAGPTSSSAIWCRVVAWTCSSGVDALLTAAAAETDQAKRRVAYVEVQKILAEELPGIPLWYPNNEVVHTRRVTGIKPGVSGSFDFLLDARVDDGVR